MLSNTMCYPTDPPISSHYLSPNTQATSPMLVYTKCWIYCVQELDLFCRTYHLYHPTMIYNINTSWTLIMKRRITWWTTQVPWSVWIVHHLNRFNFIDIDLKESCLYHSNKSSTYHWVQHIWEIFIMIILYLDYMEVNKSLLSRLISDMIYLMQISFAISTALIKWLISLNGKLLSYLISHDSSK